MSSVRYFANGAEVSQGEYVISGEDEGLTRGRAVFETLRTHHRRVFRIARHAERLAGSAEAVGVPVTPPAVVIAEIEQALRDFPTEAKINVILTGGGQRLIRVAPLDMARYGAPIRVATRRWEPPPWLDGRSKHCSRAMNQVVVQAAGVDEVFWVGRDGMITEATRSNVLAVIGGVLMTPPDDGRILAGVTRGALFDAARRAGQAITEAAFPPNAPFEELYATSTLKAIAPVVELDGQAIEGEGPVGKRLRGALFALMDQECG